MFGCFVVVVVVVVCCGCCLLSEMLSPQRGVVISHCRGHPAMELLVGPDNGARTIGAPIPRWYVETGVRAQNLDAHTKGSLTSLR